MKLYDFYVRYWRRYVGWFPVQLCMVCARPYWGGLPRFWFTRNKWSGPAGRSAWPEWKSFGCTWQASWADYCSYDCCNIDLELIKSMNAFDASQDPLKPSDFPENWLMTTPGQQAYVDLIAVPGVHKCHKCGFIQTTKILHPDTGRVGMDTTVADRACPNDGQLMIPLTWKEQAEGLERIAAEYLARINAANIALSQLQGCITELANASIENVQRMSKAGFPISEETQKSMDQITKLLALKPPQV